MINCSATTRVFAPLAIALTFMGGDLLASEATFRVFGGEISDIAADGAILFPALVRYPDGRTSPVFDAFGRGYVDYGLGTVATEISSDGSIIAGHALTNTSDFYQGWIKYGDGGYTPIGTLGGDRSLVYGMSEDGLYLAGTSYNSHAMPQGFRWSQASGMNAINYLPKSTWASVSGMSAGGHVITGTVSIVDDSFDPGFVIEDCAGECGPLIAQYSQAFIWTELTGTISLGALRQKPNTVDELGRPPVPHDTYANQISNDGLTVVGYGSTFEGWIWRAGTEMQLIPGLPNQHGMFFPLDVSGDGSVVVGGVGGSCGINCFGGPGAVIWDAAHGTRLLKEVLVEEYGLGDKIGGTFLEHATFISADGRTIAGRRDAGRGSWVVTLPWSPVEAGLVHGDYNRDGTVDIADYVVWRKIEATPSGYETWRANNGRRAVSGASVTAAGALNEHPVPEPPFAVLAILSFAAFLVYGGRLAR